MKQCVRCLEKFESECDLFLMVCESGNTLVGAGFKVMDCSGFTTAAVCDRVN